MTRHLLKADSSYSEAKNNSIVDSATQSFTASYKKT